MYENFLFNFYALANGKGKDPMGIWLDTLSDLESSSAHDEEVISSSLHDDVQYEFEDEDDSGSHSTDELDENRILERIRRPRLAIRAQEPKSILCQSQGQPSKHRADSQRQPAKSKELAQHR